MKNVEKAGGERVCGVFKTFLEKMKKSVDISLSGCYDSKALTERAVPFCGAVYLVN